MKEEEEIKKTTNPFQHEINLCSDLLKYLQQVSQNARNKKKKSGDIFAGLKKQKKKSSKVLNGY